MATAGCGAAPSRLDQVSPAQIGATERSGGGNRLLAGFLHPRWGTTHRRLPEASIRWEKLGCHISKLI